MDRYEIRRKIGQGSFGNVHIVVQRKTQRTFVMKEIKTSRLNKRERNDVQREVELLSKLSHPNIVGYIESFESVENGMVQIIMEYCDGGDLYSKINRQRGKLFPEQVILAFFVQICRAVQYIHERKILHRDIKSQNIFIAGPKQGRMIIKLGDFGIAKIMDGSTDYARTCIGTPYYLSPEVWENKPYNNKSDLWAMGCVLYEMSTLKHAFEAGCMKNLMFKIIRGSYPPLSNMYTYDLRNLVASLLRKNPRERPSINSILRKGFMKKAEEAWLAGRPERRVVHVRAEKVYNRSRPASSIESQSSRKQRSAPLRSRQPPSQPSRSYGDKENRAPDKKEVTFRDDLSFIQILSEESSMKKCGELYNEMEQFKSNRRLDDSYLKTLEVIRRGNLRERKRWLQKLRQESNRKNIPDDIQRVKRIYRSKRSRLDQSKNDDLISKQVINEKNGCAMWIDLSDESSSSSSPTINTDTYIIEKKDDDGDDDVDDKLSVQSVTMPKPLFEATTSSNNSCHQTYSSDTLPTIKRRRSVLNTLKRLVCVHAGAEVFENVKVERPKELEGTSKSLATVITEIQHEEENAPTEKVEPKDLDEDSAMISITPEVEISSKEEITVDKSDDDGESKTEEEEEAPPVNNESPVESHESPAPMSTESEAPDPDEVQVEIRYSSLPDLSVGKKIEEELRQGDKVVPVTNEVTPLPPDKEKEETADENQLEKPGQDQGAEEVWDLNATFNSISDKDKGDTLLSTDSGIFSYLESQRAVLETRIGIEALLKVYRLVMELEQKADDDKLDYSDFQKILGSGNEDLIDDIVQLVVADQFFNIDQR